MLQALAAITGGYLVGSFPTAYVVTRWRYGKDIRALGDRNVGAGNVWQVGHPIIGVLVAAVDVAKGMVTVWLARSLELTPALMGLVMLAAVAGHAWPIFLRFWGGGGVATGGGAMLAAMPVQTLTLGAGLLGLMALTGRPKVAVALGFGTMPVLAWWQSETRGLFITTLAMPFLIGVRVFQQGLAQGLSHREALRLALGFGNYDTELTPANDNNEHIVTGKAALL